MGLILCYLEKKKVKRRSERSIPCVSKGIKPCERKCYQQDQYFKIRSNDREKSHWGRSLSKKYFDRGTRASWVKGTASSGWEIPAAQQSSNALSYCPVLLISYSPPSVKHRRCISETTPQKLTNIFPTTESNCCLNKEVVSHQSIPSWWRNEQCQ